jgi:hypothetical protein
MGVITIDVPLEINESYEVDSEDSLKTVIQTLDKVAKKKKRVDLSGLVGLWADRTESAEEIARELRRRSNSRLNNG